MIPTPTLPIDAATALRWLSDMHKLGLAYHPDDDATEVGNRAPDGSWQPTFTPDDAATANYVMGRAHANLGEAVYVSRPDLWWEVIAAHMASTRAIPDMEVIGMCLSGPAEILAWCDDLRDRCGADTAAMREAAERFLSATY